MHLASPQSLIAPPVSTAIHPGNRLAAKSAPPRPALQGRQVHLSTWYSQTRRDLPRDAFTVLDAGVPQTITVFNHEDAPVTVGLVLDRSGSMSYKLEAVAAAAVAFVKDSNPQDRFFVVNFAKRPRLDADFTNELGAVRRAVEGGTIRGNTAMRDAVSFAIRHISSDDSRRNRFLLLVTDGEDIESVVSTRTLERDALGDGVVLYAVGLGTSGKAKKDLTALATATGGAAFFPQGIEEIGDLAHQVAREIRNQYTLGFTPSHLARDGTYHALQVKLDRRLRLKARGRAGYFAVPSESDR